MNKEIMNVIRDEEFGGERPLFASKGLRLEGVTVHAGESALKCCSDVVAEGCRFEGKYPFWHVDGFEISLCLFTPGARAALWYSRNLVMTDTLVEAPKMFREMENLSLTRVKIPDAQETLWHCRGGKLRDVEVGNADYLFMHSEDIDIDGYLQRGVLKGGGPECLPGRQHRQAAAARCGRHDGRGCGRCGAILLPADDHGPQPQCGGVH